MHFFLRTFSYVWPRIGFRRMGRYYKLRLQRIPGTPHRLAVGFAWGAALSMTPFVGLHALLAIVLAWVMRGSWVTALIGTLVGNPWTFPLIWVGTYKVGTMWLPGVEGDGVSFSTEAGLLFSAAKELVIGWDVDAALGALQGLRFLPVMAVGSIPFVIVVWVFSYFSVRSFVKLSRKLKAKRTAHKRATAL